MATKIELTERAFAVLESLPEKIAFDLFRTIDTLATFPEMGPLLETRSSILVGFRQLIYKRSIRVIYEFDAAEDQIYIVAIQHCRQQLPHPRDLKRDQMED